MADIYPMRRPDGEQLRYAELDWIGVEKRGETDPRGLNAMLAFPERAHGSLVVEHTDVGAHATIKIPRAAIYVRHSSGDRYVVLPESHVRGEVGSHVAQVRGQIGSPGRITVTIHAGMAGTNYRAVGAPLMTGFYVVGSVVPIVWVKHEAILSSKEFTVQRWAGDSIASLALTDGDLSILIFEG